MLFVFEDLVKLEERAVQQVLREVDQKDLVLALRGAPDEVKEVVLANMSERGAAMLKEEMEIQPPQRKRDIDAAQSRIVAVVRRARGSGHDRDRGRRGRRRARPLSEAAVSYDFEQLEPSEPPPRDAAARLLAQATARGGGDPRAGAGRRARARAARPGTSRAREEIARRRWPPCRRRCEGVQTVRDETAEAVERDAIELALALAGKIVAGGACRRVPSWSSRSCRARCGGSAASARSPIVVNPARPRDRQGGPRRSAHRRLGEASRATCRPTSASRPAARSCAPPRARWTPACRPSSSGPARWSSPSSAARRRRRERRPPRSRLERAAQAIREADLARRHGFVSNLIGLIIEATGLQAEVGEVCMVGTRTQPRRRGRRGRRLPRRPHAADAARRAARDRPRDPRARDRRAVPDRRRRRAARADRRRARACPTTAVRRRPGFPARRSRRPRAALSRPRICERVGLGVRALDGLVPCGRGPAPGHLRRLGRGQVLAAGHDRPLDQRSDQRDRARRRARPRGAGVHRARPRRRAGALGGGRRDLRPARAGADQGGLHGDHDRRALPRPGPRRDADDGLRHALRDGPARGRPGDRRAARHARLHAERVRPAAAPARARRHERRAARSRRSTRCWSTATT